MADDDFDGRMAELAKHVGDGTLTGQVVVDQVYAQYQHERLDLKHDPGRQGKYLEGPLHAQHTAYVQHLAEHVTHGSLADAMADNMDGLVGQVDRLAPIDLVDLARSGHATVTDDGALTHDRPPKVPRLDEQALKAKATMRTQYHTFGG